MGSSRSDHVAACRLWGMRKRPVDEPTLARAAAVIGDIEPRSSAFEMSQGVSLSLVTFRPPGFPSSVTRKSSVLTPGRKDPARSKKWTTPKLLRTPPVRLRAPVPSGVEPFSWIRPWLSHPQPPLRRVVPDGAALRGRI